RMFGVRDIAAWTASQAELVLPRQLPDGVLSVVEHGRTEPDIYILEIATYPDARVPSQAVRDAVLGFLERNVLPEVLVLFLHEKGHVPAADSIELRSRKGFTTMSVSWRSYRPRNCSPWETWHCFPGCRWRSSRVRPRRWSANARRGSTTRHLRRIGRTS